MHWIIAAVIAPIPLFHLWLHALLPWWKRHPWLFYLCGLVIWIAFFFYFSFISLRSEYLYEFDSVWRLAGGYTLMTIGIVGVFSSIITLGPKRFFVWAVLRPDSTPKVRLTKGPFAFIPHPAYIGELLVAMGNFLVHGQSYLLYLVIFLIVLTPIVIVLEEEELKNRSAPSPQT